MAEYKCISCGEIKESEESCSCPVCGYKMFETPYERDEVLRKEIQGFIGKLRPSEISDDSFLVFREVTTTGKKKGDDSETEIILKAQDDKRFPEYITIQGYVCAATKTEMFCSRLNESIEQIRKHIHTAYSQQYQVSLEDVKDIVEDIDAVLGQAMSAVGVNASLPENELPKIDLTYSETPNETLLPQADAILTSLTELSRKFLRFVKQNNIYGTVYRDRLKSTYHPAEDADFGKDLLRCQERIDKTLAKRYTVDLFSDGSDELYDMLKTVWNALETIMRVPVLIRKSVYTFADGTTATDDNLRTVVLERVSQRYADIDAAIYAYDFLADKSDEALFDLDDK